MVLPNGDSPFPPSFFGKLVSSRMDMDCDGEPDLVQVDVSHIAFLPSLSFKAGAFPSLSYNESTTLKPGGAIPAFYCGSGLMGSLGPAALSAPTFATAMPLVPPPPSPLPSGYVRELFDDAWVGDMDGDQLPDAFFVTNKQGLVFLPGRLDQDDGAFRHVPMDFRPLESRSRPLALPKLPPDAPSRLAEIASVDPSLYTALLLEDVDLDSHVDVVAWVVLYDQDDLFFLDSSPALDPAYPLFPALFRNLGDNTFESPPTVLLNTSHYPQEAVASASFADIDGDGSLDMAVSFVSGAPTRIFHGPRLGDGTYDEALAVSAPLSTPHIAPRLKFFDYDEDGDLDLLIAAFKVTPRRLGVIRNTAGPGAPFVPGTNVLSLVGGTTFWFETDDVDDDGDDDIVVVLGGNKVVFLRNDNAGVFVEMDRLAVPETKRGTGLALGDLDGDMDLDFCVTRAGPSVSCYLFDSTLDRFGPANRAEVTITTTPQDFYSNALVRVGHLNATQAGTSGALPGLFVYSSGELNSNLFFASNQYNEINPNGPVLNSLPSRYLSGLSGSKVDPASNVFRDVNGDGVLDFVYFPLQSDASGPVLALSSLAPSHRPSFEYVNRTTVAPVTSAARPSALLVLPPHAFFASKSLDAGTPAFLSVAVMNTSASPPQLEPSFLIHSGPSPGLDPVQIVEDAQSSNATVVTLVVAWASSTSSIIERVVVDRSAPFSPPTVLSVSTLMDADLEVSTLSSSITLDMFYNDGCADIVFASESACFALPNLCHPLGSHTLPQSLPFMPAQIASSFFSSSDISDVEVQNMNPRDDELPDLVVTTASGTVYVLLATSSPSSWVENDGKAQFVNRYLQSVGYGVLVQNAAGEPLDVNEDGVPDFVASAFRSIAVFTSPQSPMLGTKSQSTFIKPGSEDTLAVDAVVLLDVDADLVVDTLASFPESETTSSLYLYAKSTTSRGTGRGLSVIDVSGLGARLTTLAVADANQDGAPDVVFACGPASSLVGLLLNTGQVNNYLDASQVVIIQDSDRSPMFSPHSLLRLANNVVWGLVSGAEGDATPVSLLRLSLNADDLTSSPIVSVWNASHSLCASTSKGGLKPVPHSFANGAFPGMFMFACSSPGQVFTALSNASSPTGYSVASLVSLGDHEGENDQLFDAGLGDFNADGAVDLVVSFNNSGQVRVLLNAGSTQDPVFFSPNASSVVDPGSLKDVRAWVTPDLAPMSARGLKSTVVDPYMFDKGGFLTVLDADRDGADDVFALSPRARASRGLFLRNTWDDSGSRSLLHATLSSDTPRADTRLGNAVAPLVSADLDGYGYPFAVVSSHVKGSNPLAYVSTVGMAKGMFRVPRASREFFVPVDQCGFRISCVLETIWREAGRCSMDEILLPPGTYTGCHRGNHVLVHRSVVIRGLGNLGDVVLDCTRDKVGVVPTGIAEGGMAFGVGESTKLSLQNVVVVGGSTSSQGFGGGALLGLSDSHLELVNVTFVNCTAVGTSQASVLLPSIGFGGAVLIQGDRAQLTLRNVTVMNSFAGRSGGAIAVVGQDVEMDVDGLTCVGNTARVSGGCLFVESTTGTSSLSLSSLTLTHNSVSGGESRDIVSRGGALALVAAGGVFDIRMLDSRVARCGARADGGAMLLQSSLDSLVAMNLSSVVFEENVAEEGSGGAVFVVSDTAVSSVSVVAECNVVFSLNTAGLHGGGVSLDGYEAALIHGVCGGGTGGDPGGYVGNTAGRMGGAVATSGDGRVVFGEGVVARQNRALLGGVVGAAGMPGFFSGFRTSTGFAVEDSSASLPSWEGSPGSARVELVAATFGSASNGDNRASYGTVAFACGGFVDLHPSWLSLGSGSSSRPGGPSSAREVPMFVCLFEQGGVAGEPWIRVGSGEFDERQNLTGSPIASLEWEALPPERTASGEPLGEETTRVRLYDVFGRPTSDPATSLSLQFVGDSETTFAFVGDAPQVQLAVSDTIGFGRVGVGLRRGVPPGSAVTVSAGVDRSGAASFFDQLRVEARVEVTLCGPGSGALVSDSEILQCVLCTEGTFSNETSESTCSRCPSTTLLTGLGATECIICPTLSQIVPGFVVVPGENVNCSCIPGAYTAVPKFNVECQRCPEGAFCEGGTTRPVALPGYFPSEDPGVFLQCPNPEACKGGAPFKCAQGYTGLLCGACERGYYQLNRSCYVCDDRTVPVLTLLVCVGTAFIALLVWLNMKEDLTYRFAAVLIAVTNLQIMAFVGSLDLPWPGFADAVFEVISLFNVSFDLSSPECAATTDNAWLLKWWLTVLLPILAVLPFGFVIGLGWGVLRLGRAATWNLATLMSAARRAYLQMLVLLYLPLSAMATSYLSCRKDKDGRWVLEPSPDKTCYAGWYWNYFAFAIVFTLLYLVGIPGLVFFVLTRLRAKHDSSVILVRYAFLTGRFHERSFRFETWILVRKAWVIVAVTAFQTPLSKAYAGMYGLALSFTQLVKLEPYQSEFHNGLAMVCLASAITVLWGGTMDEETARIWVVVGGLLVHLVVVVGGVAVDTYLIATREEEAESQFDQDECFVLEAPDSMELSRFDSGSVSLSLVSDECGTGRDLDSVDVSFVDSAVASPDIVTPLTP